MGKEEKRERECDAVKISQSMLTSSFGESLLWNERETPDKFAFGAR